MAEELLKLSEIAAELRVSSDAVRYWCRTGRLPATMVGGQWRVRRADLEAFLKARTEEATNPKKVDALAAVTC